MPLYVLTLLVVCRIGVAAASSGTISGTVEDVSGLVVTGVRVSAVTAAQSTLQSVLSDASGRFALVGLAPGSYVVSATKAGFAEWRRAVTVGAAPAALTVRLSVHPVNDTVTVSAESSRAAAVASTVQPVSVIGREELALGAVAVLSDAGDGSAGVQQLRTSPTLGGFFVRGLTGKNVAVYRDGVRYTNSTQRGGISTFFNLLRPEGVEAVEVLRGPNSAQYGSDAVGGTVAVVSRAAFLGSVGPRRWHGQVAPVYQSATHGFGSHASLGYSGERFGMQSHFGGQRSNTLRTGGGIDSHAAVTRFLGLPSRVMGERLPDTGFTAYGGTLHGQVRVGRGGQLSGHYERSQQDGGKRYDQLLGGDGNWIADLRNLMLDFGYLRYQAFAVGPFDQVAVTGSYNAQREERVNQGGQGNPNATITHQYEKTRAAGVQFFLEKQARRGQLLLGGEGYRETVTAPSYAYSASSGVVSLVRPRVPDGARYWSHGTYAQAAWQPLSAERLRISGAMRWGGASYRSRAANSPVVNGRRLWPDDSLSANALTGRAGMMVWLTDWLGSHVHYSRGFRVPNITDLAGIGLQGNGAFEAAVADLAGRGAVLGDRADDRAQSTGRAVERLRPEVSDNVDAGVRVRLRRVEADFTAFRLSLDHTIVSQTLLLPQGAVGQTLGDQVITRQLTNGAVFVPLSASPVLVRANFSGARIRGVEQSLRLHLPGHWTLGQNFMWLEAADRRTGLPPDIEPGTPAPVVNGSLGWRPAAQRYWVEVYATMAARQVRLSSLALADRRIGNPRSQASIAAFFNNGARTRGLVVDGVLLATRETLAQVQNRVLGEQESAPQFTAVPAYGTVGVRGGVKLSENVEVLADVANLADRNYRGIGWGVDAAGRGVTVRLRYRF